jgi:V8-like Glu-specific endopeptidase
MKSYCIFTNRDPDRSEEITKIICGRAPDSEFCKIATNIPEATGIEELSEEIKPIGNEDLTDILRARLDRLKKNRSSFNLVVGESDYLSSAFLERGLRSSTSVCLLQRGYWLETLIEKIKDSSVKRRQEVLRRLSEKLGLLSVKFPGGDADIWQKYDRVSQALEDEVIKKSLEQFRERLSALSDEDKRREGTIFIPYATGFLVGKAHLLTNFHVFNDRKKDEIKDFIAQFRYEQNALGQNVKAINYQLDPDSLCISDEELDYTLVGVKALDNAQSMGLVSPEAGTNFGWMPLLADPNLVAPPFKRRQARILAKRSREIELESLPNGDLAGEPVFIVQHPQGGQKKIVLFNNRVQNVSQNFLQYEADADFGSSGSPILNARWQLVGLHHAALVKWREDDIEVEGNLGIRTCAIVKHLEANRGQPGIADYLDNERYVVRPGEQPFKGTIYTLIGYQRGDAPTPEHATQEVEIAKTILGNIGKFSTPSFEIQDVLQACSKYDAGVDYINQQSSEIGDVSIELRVSFDPNSSEIGTKATLYYSAQRLEDHKTYAEIVLQGLLSEDSRIPNTVQSTSAAPEIDLQFCENVKMPSIVLTLNFLGMDYEAVKKQVSGGSFAEQKAAFGQGIWKGLESWVRVLSPIGFQNLD